MCDSYEAFKKGKCTLCNQNDNLCFRFGFHSRVHYDKALKRKLIDGMSPIATYLLTSDRSPFCVTHYNVTVKISDSEESKRNKGDVGILYFKLKSRTHTTQKIYFNSVPMVFLPGSIHAKLTTSNDTIPIIESAIVVFSTEPSFNPLTWRIFTSKIYIDYIQIESMEFSSTQKLCPGELGSVEGKETIFRSDLCWKRTYESDDYNLINPTITLFLFLRLFHVNPTLSLIGRLWIN